MKTIRNGPDGKPHVYQWGDVWDTDYWSYWHITDWDGRGLIAVERRIFDDWLIKPNVGDSFAVAGFNLLCIDRELWQDDLICMVDNPAAHLAFIYRLLHFNALRVWVKLTYAKYPAAHTHLPFNCMVED